MKPGDRIFWRRFLRDSGVKNAIRVPAIFIGRNPRDRDIGYVYALDEGAVQKRTVKMHNLLPRDMDKEIDTAAAGRALYMGRPPTEPQLSALEWLKAHGGLEVPNMDLNGRSKEWPRHQTLEGLQERGLITVEQKGTYWRCEINPLGEDVLREREDA